MDGVNIDTQYPGWKDGDLFIPASGYPIEDSQSRVTGDANPDWTAAFRNTVTIGNTLSISGLFDIKHGGDAWNGTKGALYYFGTHADMAQYQGAGKNEIFGQTEINYVVGNSHTQWPARPGSIGRPYPGHRVALIDDEGIVYADIDLNRCIQPKQMHDIVGHYNRFDVFDFKVNRRPLSALTWGDAAAQEGEGAGFSESLPRS